MAENSFQRLLGYGALPSQLVDLCGPDTPRTLRYVDLVRTPTAGQLPVVFESQGQPRAYVFDAGAIDSDQPVKQWIRRVAFRGDADWVGVLRPGRLDVFSATLDDGGSPTPLSGLPEGSLLLPTLIHTTLEGSGTALGVRRRLLELLRRSVTQAKTFGIAPPDALSIVGRALFWRFLIDRGLLEGLDSSEICHGATSWPECLTTKTNALKTFAWLDETFNGGLLPFISSARTFDPDVFRTVVGNIAHLATADGQLSLKLPNDWSEVNFAHIPVGLLSEVYESYAHGEDRAQARAESVFYTPRHIAEFVVDTSLEALDDIAEPRVLDPAVGAGVFLVAMFRALVVREWTRSGKRPSRKVVRQILNEQLCGFDINDSALRLAELALYLTAIELDPERNPRPLRLLRFDKLRERVLWRKMGGIDEGSLKSVEEPFRARFDIVIGNPPWTANAPLAAKKRWATATRSLVKTRLGEVRAASFAFPDTNPDLPFVYRAMEWAKPGGSIALVTHGRWLFAQSAAAIAARNDLLECVHVTGILNGAALRNTNVWPNVSHPFCLLFASNEVSCPRTPFLFVSPELDRTPDARQERIRIDWQDAREIEVGEVVSRPWALKVRFRGTPFDESLIDELFRCGIPLGKYLESIGTELKNGYQVGGSARKQVSAMHMHGLPDLKGTDLSFFVDTDRLPQFARSRLLYPRAPEIYRPPILLVHESIRVDAQSPRAALSFAAVAFDERLDGASFSHVADGNDIAAYLQLAIQSSIFLHALLMLDGQFGVEREVVHLSTIESVPVVPWKSLSSPQRSRCAMLSRRLRDGMSTQLLMDIDRFIAGTFGLSNVARAVVADTLATSLPTASAKQNALRATTLNEREIFGSVCRKELDDVLSASRKRAFVRLREDLVSETWRILQIDWAALGDAEPDLAQFDPKVFVSAGDDASASVVLIRINKDRRLVAVLDRYRYWTSTRARLFAAALLSES